jgi:hypothetical protein
VNLKCDILVIQAFAFKFNLYRYAPADTPPFAELTLDDPEKRLDSGCFIARQLCGMGWRVAFNRQGWHFSRYFAVKTRFN